jgi:membrane-associated protein
MIDELKQALHAITDVQGIVTGGGTALVCTIIFVETGLFLGFFLPGDSLLVTAGVFASTGHLDLASLLFFCSVCAVMGDQVGYAIGHRAGKTLYNRPDSRFFKRKHLERTHAFYEKHGPKTIVMARFVPIVRTFAPAVAGAAGMNYRRFVTYNIAGGLLWVLGMVLLGYFLGELIPNIDRNIHYVIVVVIALSLLPPIIEILRERRRSVPDAQP